MPSWEITTWIAVGASALAAVLLLTSLVKLQRIELGFNPVGLASAYVGLAPTRTATLRTRPSITVSGTD